MARRARPAGENEARGNPGKRKRVAQDAAFDPAAGAPAWLKEEARVIWGQLAPGMEQQRLLSATDAMAFGRYCWNLSLWIKCTVAVEDGGIVEVTSSEHVTMTRINKNLQAALILERHLMAAEERFGLNPRDRQRIVMMRAASVPQIAGELPLPPVEKPGEEPAMGFLVN
jgi:P27 family predicted phage terminase small subunit